MRNLQAGQSRQMLEGTAGIDPPESRYDCPVGSFSGLRLAAPTTTSSSRTSTITRRVSSVILRAAARCSAPSVGSMPSNCASARSAASGLFSWCWTRTMVFRNSLCDVAASECVCAPLVAAPSSPLSGEDAPVPFSVTTDAARVPTIVLI